MRIGWYKPKHRADDPFAHMGESPFLTADERYVPSPVYVPVAWGTPDLAELPKLAEVPEVSAGDWVRNWYDEREREYSAMTLGYSCV